MKKLFLILFVIPLFWGCESEEKVKSDIDRLKATRTELQTEVRPLADNVAKLRSEKADLEVELTQLNLSLSEQRKGKRPVYLLTLELKQSHVTLDLKKLAKDEMNAIKFTLAVDQDLYNSVEKGDNIVTASKWYGSKLKPFSVDRKLYGAVEDIVLGGKVIKAIHTPGHSPGSVVYMTESEGFYVIFAQDVHGPLDPSILSNREDYERSLEVLLSLEPDILCEGHYGIYNGKANAEEFIRSFMTA